MANHMCVFDILLYQSRVEWSKTSMLRFHIYEFSQWRILLASMLDLYIPTTEITGLMKRLSRDIFYNPRKLKPGFLPRQQISNAIRQIVKLRELCKQGKLHASVPKSNISTVASQWSNGLPVTASSSLG
jgi:hypothetical protein